MQQIHLPHKGHTLTSIRSISWFTIVGIVAAVVHYVCAVSLEVGTSITPAYANIAGFLVAFPVSYLGHRRFSFSHQDSIHRQALPRFFAVAGLGFTANQLLVICALRFTPMPFWLALAIVMIVIALSTFILSRYWAFKST